MPDAVTSAECAGGRPVASIRAPVVSVLSNTALIVLKLGAAALTGSVAILSEALHSSIDLLASVMALVSVRKAAKPPDALHRYGHARIENLTAAVEGILILVGAGLIILEAVPRLTSKAAPQRVGVGVAVLGVSAAANFLVSRYLARSARSSGSAAVAGNATHVRTDVFTSLAVVSGLLLARSPGARGSTRSSRWGWPRSSSSPGPG